MCTLDFLTNGAFAFFFLLVPKSLALVWFLEIFAEDIGRPEELKLVFISDRQKVCKFLLCSVTFDQYFVC